MVGFLALLFLAGTGGRFSSTSKTSVYVQTFKTQPTQSFKVSSASADDARQRFPVFVRSGTLDLSAVQYQSVARIRHD